MDHIVYLDYKSKELENLISGKKNMIIRGAMGRKIPHGRVNKNDVLYFIENKGDGLVKAKAEVADVYTSKQLAREESINIIESNQKQLLLNAGMIKRFSGKRYLVLITVSNFQELEHFRIDRSNYGNMDDWLLVEKIENVML
jgi:hypothetical protein